MKIHDGVKTDALATCKEITLFQYCYTWNCVYI